MAPFFEAYFTPHQWSAMVALFSYVLFPYGSLQVAAVWAVRHPAARVAALLPILLMWRVIMIGMQPGAFGGGSLYGIIIMFVQWPCMVYLGIFVLVGVMCRLTISKVHTSSSMTIGEESTRE